VSETSTRKIPNYTDDSRAAPNRSVFRAYLQNCSCNTHQERYSLAIQRRKRRFQLTGSGWKTGLQPTLVAFLLMTCPLFLIH
jgi:hypothetical protein